MIIATRRGGNAEVRANPFQNAHLLGPYMGRLGGPSVAGPVVNVDSAASLPTVADALRLVAESVAMVPCVVYEGDPLDRERARDSWQWQLLHDMPNPDVSAFDFFSDVQTSLETDGNAYIWKLKVEPGRVEALYVLDPTLITVTRNDRRQKVFRVMMDNRPMDVTADTIIHIRGWSTSPGSDKGVSTIGLHRESLGRAMATEQFESRFYRNGTSVGGVIQAPGKLSRQDADDMRSYFADKHSGIENAHKPAVLYNGAEYKPLGITLQDAQFIESRRFTVEEIARMFRVSPQMLVVGETNTTAQDFERFLKVDLAPRFRRIELALRADRDLFPAGDLFCEFLADAVLRPDIKTRYEAYRLARQGGWLAPNEIRERENLAPVDGGDDIQITPVGGAPNPGQANEPGKQVDNE